MTLHLADTEHILAAARAHCEKRGARLTTIREQVLRLILSYPYVVKAYDLLNGLQKLRGNAAPPTVYRALDFLVEMGILHRTESLNGFVFCPDFEHEHQSLITNCHRCGKTTEITANQEIYQLIDFCAKHQFALSHAPVVLAGLCADCQQEEEEGADV